MSSRPDAAPVLAGHGLTVAYEKRVVVEDLDIAVEAGTVTAIIGPNGSGKSTLLRTLARLMRPRAGTVLLDGDDIRSRPTRAVARRLGLLPQSPNVPDQLTVEELVRRGRYPHRSWWQQWSRADEQAVAQAMDLAAVADLAARPVDELSGGQRQRVWIATALAQDAEIMLLDEPTTFLDLAHRLEVLDLVGTLHRDHGRTIVLVLHDLADAARVADRLVAVADGTVVAEGRPEEVLTPALVEAVFGVQAMVLPDPYTGRPVVLPAPRGWQEPDVAPAAEPVAPGTRP
ncbi:MAG: ABC transporter ATP-binding protein [Acidimicrobiia bacterium]